MILRYGFLTILVALQVRCLNPEGCDPSLNGGFREGILGQVGMFPWLGVIRVQLYEGEKIRTALTGAILIKENFALAIADDIARIPDSIFRRDTQALFIPKDSDPWLCKLKNYKTHPEYPAIKNTIALIELEFEDKGPAPLVPICWPPKRYNASNQIYVFGITDANDILEKEAYKVQYVQPTKCKHWYRNEGLETDDDRRREYQCAAAENSNKKCVYETGMVLAANATGPWVLLGFGVHGPGCASPARFIEIGKYLPWIETVTTNNRKSALREGPEIRDIPVHQLFRTNNDIDSDKLEQRIVPWYFDRYESGLVPEISRIDQDAIILFSKKYELEKRDCTKMSKLIYTDSFKMHADDSAGKALYQLSLMDLSVFNYTCVLIRVDAKQRKKAKLWYNYGSFIDNFEGFDETPSKLVKKYPIPRRQTNATSTTKKPRRVGRRIINNSRRYKKLISDSLINDLQEIKNDLEITGKELNTTGKADIDKTFRKIFAIKGQLTDVRDKLGGPAPDCLKYSIDILDKAGSELRAGRIFYQGQLLNVQKQEVQKSLDLINQFREQTETSLEVEIEATVEPDSDEMGTTKKQRANGRQGKNKPFVPHDMLEPQYITDRPGWWLYHPHLNLELEFRWVSEAELTIEIYSHLRKTRPTRGPKYDETTRTRKMYEEQAARTAADTAGGGGGFDIHNLPPGVSLPLGFDPKTWRVNNPPDDFAMPPGYEYILPPKNPVRKQFLKKDSKFRTYAERKRAEYNETEITKIRGVDLYDVEMTGASDTLRSERLCLVVAMFCIILRDLF